MRMRLEEMSQNPEKNEEPQANNVCEEKNQAYSRASAKGVSPKHIHIPASLNGRSSL